MNEQINRAPQGAFREQRLKTGGNNQMEKENRKPAGKHVSTKVKGELGKWQL